MGKGSGGGGSSPTGTQTNISDLPEWAKPYAQQTLAQGQALTQQPYQTYNAPRIAGFTDLQQQAQQQAAGMTPASQLGTATGLANIAGLSALGTQYNAPSYSSTYQAPGQYQPTSTDFSQVSAPQLQQFQMQGPESVRTGSFARPGTVNQYMNPYLQAALAPQMELLGQQQAQQGQQLASQASQAGAFGGSRYGIQQGLQNQANQLAMSNLVGQGYNQAYQQAAQQYSTDAARQLQAQLANQQAGLTTQQQNLAAALGVQQLGAGQNLQSQLANQQAQLAANQLAAQQQQYGYGQQMNAAQQAAQYGLSAQQLAAQQQQFGANLGMQGLSTGLQAAGQLGQLGGQQFGQQMGINQLMNQYGTQQQALRQQGLSQAYQDFINQQNYPYTQLGFMANLVRGIPTGMQSTSNVYQGALTPAQTISTLGLGAYGLNQLGMMGGAKEGGLMESYAEGGSVESPDNVASIVSRLSDPQLNQAMQSAQARGDYEQIQAITAEKAMRASERGGLAGAFNQLPYERQQQMASGGMVAFADGGIPRYNGQGGSLIGTFKDFLNQSGISAQDYMSASPEEQAKVRTDYENSRATRTPTVLEQGIKSVGSAASKIGDYASRGLGALNKVALPYTVFQGLFGTSDEEMKTLKAADLKRATDAAVKASSGADAQGYDPSQFPMPQGGDVTAQAPSTGPSGGPSVRPPAGPSAGPSATGAATGAAPAGSISAAIPDYMAQGLALSNQIAAMKPTAPQDREAFTQQAVSERERAIGTNPAIAAMQKMVEQGQTDQDQILRQGRGLGALMAASAIAQPGRFGARAGEAFAAFGGEYSKALQAARAEKKATQSAQINLLNAQHMEKVGNYDAAQKLYADHKQDLRQADQFNFMKTNAQANIIHGIGQLDLQRKQIEEMAKYRAAAGEPSMVKIAERYMREDKNLSFEQAMDKASKAAGYAFRSYESGDLQRARLLEQLRKDNPFFSLTEMELDRATDPKKRAELQQRLDEMERRAYGRLSVPKPGAGSAAKGNWSIEPAIGG